MSLDLLLSEIQGGVRLRPTKTVDKSRPVLKAEIDLPPRQIVATQPSQNETEAKGPPVPSGLPPPPPPPPLPTSVGSKKVARPIAMRPPSRPVDRDALMAEIRGGVRLKRVANSSPLPTNEPIEPPVEPAKTSPLPKSKPILVVEPLPKRKPKDDWITQSPVISEMKKFTPERPLHPLPKVNDVPVKSEPPKSQISDKTDSPARANGIRKLSPPAAFLVPKASESYQPRNGLSPTLRSGSFKPDYSGNVVESKTASPTKPVGETISQLSTLVRTDRSFDHRPPQPFQSHRNESIKTELVNTISPWGTTDVESPPPLPTTCVPEMDLNRVETVRNDITPGVEVVAKKSAPRQTSVSGDPMVDKTVAEGSDLSSIKRILLNEYVGRPPAHTTPNSSAPQHPKAPLPPALNGNFVDAKPSQNGFKMSPTQPKSTVDDGAKLTSPVRAEPHKTGLIPRVSDIKQRYEDLKKSAAFQTPMAYKPDPTPIRAEPHLTSTAERVEQADSTWRQGRAVVAQIPQLEVFTPSGFVRATPATVVPPAKLDESRKKWRSVAELKVEREFIVPLMTTTTSIELEDKSDPIERSVNRPPWKSYKPPEIPAALPNGSSQQGYTSRVETTVITNGFGTQYVRKTQVISNSHSAEDLLNPNQLEQLGQMPVEQLKSRLKFKIDLEDLNCPIGLQYRN